MVPSPTRETYKEFVLVPSMDIIYVCRLWKPINFDWRLAGWSCPGTAWAHKAHNQLGYVPGRALNAPPS